MVSDGSATPGSSSSPDDHVNVQHAGLGPAAPAATISADGTALSPHDPVAPNNVNQAIAAPVAALPDTAEAIDFDTADLTDPAIAILAPPGMLLGLDEAAVVALKGRLTFHDCLLFKSTPERQAAINIDNVKVPVLDHGLPYLPMVANQFVGPDGTVMVHMSPAPADRWYNIVCGCGFTGAARGAAEYGSKVHGHRGAKGTGSSSLEMARFEWLCAYYRGETRIL